VSSVAGYTPQGLPIINSSTAQTKARLEDGSILILGGLTRQEKVESKQGMPFLSSLPVLGYLFGGENNINRETQIVIVIEGESETGGETKLANAAEIQTIAQQVEGESIPTLPKNPFGFDMWLLGPKSGAQL
jgi:type II secretory pathway component GspD/PulD (secretin)